MFKVKLKQTALLVLTLLATTMATAQTVDMSKYITLTVTQGQQIKLRFQAAAAGTKIKVKSGSTERVVTVGTSWTGNQNYTAGAATMTVYGDITGFNCSGNGAKLTALDVSHNTTMTELVCNGNQLAALDVTQNTALTKLNCGDNQLAALDVSHNTTMTELVCNGNQLAALDVTQNTALTNLYCYGNSFTTQAFNDLMCSLPARTAADNAGFYPLWNASDAKYADFRASNSQIATAKNWKVLYGAGGAITGTNGTYTCPASVNMSRYITLTVTQRGLIRLGLKAAAEGTPVKIVSGSDETEVTVDTSWTGFRYYSASATTMIVYGDIVEFNCFDNRANLTAIDASHNTALIELDCSSNQLTSLNVSQNTALEYLDCGVNRLTALDVSHNTALIELDCSSNQLTSLNVSQNTALTKLYCFGNRLGSLNVSQNTVLTELDCRGNRLTSLDVSQNTSLTELNCLNNPFTTQAFNDLMCSLPARTTADNAKFFPLLNASDAAAATFRAANAWIARNKNWKVRYGLGSEDETPGTTGTYACPASVNMSKYITLTVTQGEQIRLDLRAAAAGTPVKVVSGSTETVVTVGTNWTGFQNYTAGAGTMTIYGDITGFDCSENEAKLTALDASQNTALKTLICNDNNFTTQAFNDLMCSLPARTAADNARFFPLFHSSDAGAAAFMAANAQIATAKNWEVRYYYDDVEIPPTTGTYVCPAAGIAEVASVPLAVYPNPATDILTVETEATGAVITLADLTGRTVMTATATERKTTLNISELSAGTYIVRVGNRVGKVVKR